MKYVLFCVAVIFSTHEALGLQCHVDCPEEDNLVCGFDSQELTLKMFPSKCAMKAHGICSGADFEAIPLKYCVKNHFTSTRRVYGESCPVFCPQYYRPVCGASKYRDYMYRSFNNGCYLDMINCRGDDDFTGYVEVPLHYCQRHAMKNIFKEQLQSKNK